MYHAACGTHSAHFPTCRFTNNSDIDPALPPCAAKMFRHYTLLPLSTRAHDSVSALLTRAFSLDAQAAGLAVMLLLCIALLTATVVWGRQHAVQDVELTSKPRDEELLLASQ